MNPQREKRIYHYFLEACKNNDIGSINEVLTSDDFSNSTLINKNLFIQEGLDNLDAHNDNYFSILKLFFSHTSKDIYQQKVLQKALLMGISLNHIEWVDFSIKNGVDVNCAGQEALFRATKSPHGNALIVDLLLKANATVEQQGSGFNHGSGPLYHAIFNGHLDIVKVLLPKYKSIDFRDYYLSKCIQKNEHHTNEVLKYVIDYDMSHNKFTPVKIFDRFLSLSLRFEKVQRKAQQKNFVFADYDELLKVSAQEGNLDIMSFLLTKGRNKKIVQWYGNEASQQFLERYSLKEQLNVQLGTEKKVERRPKL